MKKVINGELRTLTQDLTSYYKRIGNTNRHDKISIKPTDIVEDYKPVVDGILAITNGSVNQHITEDILHRYDSYTKKNVLWRMIVNTLEEYRSIYLSEDITGEKSNTSLIYSRYLESKTKKELDKIIKDKQEGREAYYFMQKHTFDMQFSFNIYQAIGYLREQGSWNGFNVKKALPLLTEMDKTAPVTIKDKNNPNYGNVNHKIQILKNGAYIVFNWEYIGSLEELNEIKLWYENSRRIKNELEADNYRIEVEEYKPLGEDKDFTTYSAEIVLWWD